MSSIAPRLPPKCARCKTIQITPEWSEIGNENEIVYYWRCAVCGHEFETRDHLAGQPLSRDELTEELAEEFLPNLVVE